MRYDKIIEEKPVHGSVNTIPSCYREVKERKMQPSLQQALEPDRYKQTPSLACNHPYKTQVQIHT
jgi:hypothetical protein